VKSKRSSYRARISVVTSSLFVMLTLHCGETPAIDHWALFPLGKDHERVLISESGKYSLVLRVVDTTVNESSGFRMVSEEDYLEGSLIASQTLLFGIDSLGNLLRRAYPDDSLFAFPTLPDNDPPKGLVSVWYKGDARTSDSWISYANAPTYPKFLRPYTIRLDSVFTLHAFGKNRRCLVFYVDEHGSDDSEYWDWILEGVGIIRRVYYSWTHGRSGYVWMGIDK